MSEARSELGPAGPVRDARADRQEGGELPAERDRPREPPVRVVEDADRELVGGVPHVLLHDRRAALRDHPARVEPELLRVLRDEDVRRSAPVPRLQDDGIGQPRLRDLVGRRRPAPALDRPRRAEASARDRGRRPALVGAHRDHRGVVDERDRGREPREDLPAARDPGELRVGAGDDEPRADPGGRRREGLEVSLVGRGRQRDPLRPRRDDRARHVDVSDGNPVAAATEPQRLHDLLAGRARSDARHEDADVFHVPPPPPVHPVSPRGAPPRRPSRHRERGALPPQERDRA